MTLATFFGPANITSKRCSTDCARSSGVSRTRICSPLSESLSTTNRSWSGSSGSPAALNLHHAYIGGLLEHTLGLLELGLVVIPRYPRLSLDLVLTGLFLHDIGKTAELSCDADIAYTEEGQLIGHITQAVLWIDQKISLLQERERANIPHATSLGC